MEILACSASIRENFLRTKLSPSPPLPALLPAVFFKRVGVSSRLLVPTSSGSCSSFQGCFHDFSDSLRRILPHELENTPVRTSFIILVTLEDTSNSEETARRLRIRPVISWKGERRGVAPGFHPCGKKSLYHTKQ